MQFGIQHKEYLQKLYEIDKFTIDEIAAEFGVSHSTILRAFKKLDIKIVKMTDRYIQKLSISHLGKHHSNKTKEKMSISQSDERNSQWIDGRSKKKNNYKNFSNNYKMYIRNIFYNTCFLCGVKENNLDRKLHVHHIDYNKENSAIINLVPLCDVCHGKTTYKRSLWQNWFESIFITYGYTIEASCL